MKRAVSISVICSQIYAFLCSGSATNIVSSWRALYACLGVWVLCGKKESLKVVNLELQGFRYSFGEV